MSTSKGRVRPRRRGDSGGSGPVVAVTGAADGLGRALATHLAASPEVGKVIAIDGQRGDVAGVTWRVVDVRDPLVAGRLTGVDVVVHLDIDRSLSTPSRERRSANVRGAQTVLTAAAAERVPHVILVTSAMVYGARPDNDVPLAEDSPLRADSDPSLVGDMLEIEQLAAQARRTHPGLKVTVARPAALVVPGMDTVVTRHFESPRLLTVKGVAQRWQFCHVDDLVTALECAALGRVEGDFAVGGEGWLEQDEVEEISELRRIELPAAVTFGTAQRLHRLGITPAPATDLHYVVYPCVVDCAALREAGWRPKHDNAESLRTLLASRTGHALVGRHVGRKEATLTAAGATVAVIGAAAIVRRARRRRRGL